MKKSKQQKELNTARSTVIALIIIAVMIISTLLIISYHKNKSPQSINQENLIGNDTILGNPNASVTIVEFADYECPYCRSFYLNTFSQIKNEYINTGKARYIFRNYPLSIHPYAEKAAEAAECAGEQGKYYEMGDLLYGKGVEGGVDEYKGYAKELNLNTTEFNYCLDSNKTVPEIERDIADANKIGVDATPTFLINGKEIIGAQPYSVFKQAIDKALK